MASMNFSTMWEGEGKAKHGGGPTVSFSVQSDSKAWQRLGAAGEGSPMLAGDRAGTPTQPDFRGQVRPFPGSRGPVGSLLGESQDRV